MSVLLEKCTVSQGTTLKDIHLVLLIYVCLYSFTEHSMCWDFMMSKIQSFIMKFVLCLGSRYLYVNSDFYYTEINFVIKLLSTIEFFDCVLCNINLHFGGHKAKHNYK